MKQHYIQLIYVYICNQILIIIQLLLNKETMLSATGNHTSIPFTPSNQIANVF